MLRDCLLLPSTAGSPTKRWQLLYRQAETAQQQADAAMQQYDEWPSKKRKLLRQEADSQLQSAIAAAQAGKQLCELHGGCCQSYPDWLAQQEWRRQRQQQREKEEQLTHAARLLLQAMQAQPSDEQQQQLQHQAASLKQQQQAYAHDKLEQAVQSVSTRLLLLSLPTTSAVQASNAATLQWQGQRLEALQELMQQPKRLQEWTQALIQASTRTHHLMFPGVPQAPQGSRLRESEESLLWHAASNCCSAVLKLGILQLACVGKPCNPSSFPT